MKKRINKLNDIDKEIEELERKKKHINQLANNRRKKDERKQRTHRLVQTGALAEKYLEIHNLSLEEREQLFKMFSTFIKANKPNNLKK